jgi:hypothetical protein
MLTGNALVGNGPPGRPVSDSGPRCRPDARPPVPLRRSAPALSPGSDGGRNGAQSMKIKSELYVSSDHALQFLATARNPLRENCAGTARRQSPPVIPAILAAI